LSVCGLQSAVFSLQSSVSSRAGFTLLELMTVMVIMFILMGMSTLALRGVMRGAGISGAVSNTKAVLTQARQHAIVNQRPTAVVFRRANNTMTIVTRYGKASGESSALLQTQTPFPWSEASMQRATVFNMDTGGFGVISNAAASATDYQQFRLLGMSSGSWEGGDEVGLAVGAERALPVGMEFGALPSPPVVIFNADGSARKIAEVGLREKNVVTDGLQVWSAGEDGADDTEDDVLSWRQSQ
jgi:prepilin-type N-terminal cleavage/methylation domain-containing protein